jgi:hypothetical protein
MTTRVKNPVTALTLIGLGLAIGAMGIYVGEADDAPGAGGIGLILMVAGIVLGVRAARGRLPKWAARTAIAGGIVFAVLAALLSRGVAVAAPLFPQLQEVPSVVGVVPLPDYAAAVDRARQLVRAAVLEQNLPGVSVAVGTGDTVLWTEGFGWRDVVTQTPVTPDTRFNIGTAGPRVADAVARLELAHTGADSAADWSPEHIGEPEEDFPLFTIIRQVIFKPLGLAPAEPLAGERATFYVPRYDNQPRRGRRLMSMRDLACCANGMAFSSTPADLVRVAQAANTGSLNGELAGGLVMSLVRMNDRDVVIAVTSNIAHANTASLAVRIGALFAGTARSGG